MAITYHAGRRLQGLSTDIAQTVTYTGDMSTGWTTGNAGNGFTLDGTSDEIDFLYDGNNYSNENVAIDLDSLVSGAISTSAWILRFAIEMSGTASGDNVIWWNGVSSDESVAANTNLQSFIGESAQTQNGSTASRPYLSMCNNSKLEGSDVQNRLQLGGSNISDFTGKNYFEIIRDGSNFTVNLYSDSYSTLIGTKTNAVSNEAGGTLRYFISANYQQGHNVTGTLSEFKFYNGVTSLSSKPTNVQAGSRFEETDTRKMYHYTYDWFLEGTTIPPQPSSRGLFAGGEVSTDTIDYITIATAGNATDFGNLTLGRHNASAVSSGTRAVFIAGTTGTYTDTMDYVTVATTGTATDFGDTLSAIQSGAGVSSETRGVTGGGNTSGGVSNVIQYITIDTLGNATTFGVNLTQARHSPSGVSSGTRGVWMGGFGSGNVSTMDYITIATTGTCTNFGNLLASRRAGAGCGSTTRGLIGGGYEGGHVNTIEYITIASTGNSTDFGDLTRSNNVLGACSSDTRGVWGGGNNTNVNTIDYVTIDATGNATDFGDLTAGRAGVVGTDGY